MDGERESQGNLTYRCLDDDGEQKERDGVKNGKFKKKQLVIVNKTGEVCVFYDKN